tara:strand:- start:171 stop:992 length:822 start_codon:yes stop_codon:yes gene_type:complete
MSGLKYYFHVDDFGISKNISLSIIKSLTKGNLNSVSIIMNCIDKKYHFKLKSIKNINKRLHLNLTEIPSNKIKENKFLSNLSFIRLIFLGDYKKKVIYKEIISQINEYKKIYRPKHLKIDGHEHVHMIPWVLRYLLQIKKKYKIKEIRNSNEKLVIPKFKDLINLRYYRNLIACFVIKFFYFIEGKPKLSNHNFFGIVYSNLQSHENIMKYLNFIRKKKIKKFEILLHSGIGSLAEKKFFRKSNLNFYTSKKRKEEFKLTFSKKITQVLKDFN